jgi:hypothetical protein
VRSEHPAVLLTIVIAAAFSGLAPAPAPGLPTWTTADARLLPSAACHCPPGPRAGQTARPGNRKGHTMTEEAVGFAGNLTDNPEVHYTEAGIARAMFRTTVAELTPFDRTPGRLPLPSI